MGDGLGPLSSARGPLEEVHVLPRTGHLALLTDPAVAGVLAELVVYDATTRVVCEETDAVPG